MWYRTSNTSELILSRKSQDRQVCLVYFGTKICILLVPSPTISLKLLPYIRFKLFLDGDYADIFHFFDNTSYISDLTIYSNGHQITGISDHGQSIRSISQCEGCPIHLHLQPNERIVSLWLRMPIDHSNHECDPNILVSLTIYIPILTNIIRLRPVITVHVSSGHLFILLEQIFE